MLFLTQTATVLGVSLQSLPQRLRPALITVLGIAGAVAATLGLLAMGAGLNEMATRDVGPSRVLVLSGGASSEPTGDLSAEQVGVIASAPGVRRGADGRTMAQPMAVILVDLVRRDDHSTYSMTFRGTGPQGLAMQPGLRLTSGRMFRSGARELIVGRRAAAEFEGLEVGSTLSLRGAPWTVVGEFEDRGSLSESELLTDVGALLSISPRRAYQSVALELEDPAAFDRLQDALSSDPRVSAAVYRYRDFLSGQMKELTSILNFVAYVVGAIMAVGAVFATVNTLYSAVDARAREIATLRAIGFNPTSVAISVLAEAIVLAAAGAVLGTIVVWILSQGQDVAMRGLSFGLAITPQVVVVGVGLSLLVGLLGALAPAIRAARRPLAAALRAV